MAEKQFTVIKLYFKSGLHLSLGKTDNYDRSQLRLHSDTFKSALFVTALQLFPELLKEDSEKDEPAERYVEQYQFFQQFKLSSGFPFLELEGKTLYFLPKPMKGFGLEFEEQEEENADQKLIGKIQYVEKNTLLKALREGLKIKGHGHFTDDRKFFAHGESLQGKRVFKNTIQQHVAIPRGGNDDGNPFGVDKLFFEEGAGLYFLVDTDDKKLIDKLTAILRLLGDTGLGTDKTMGGGQFTYKVTDELFNWPAEDGRLDMQMNLSLYWPQEGELQDTSGTAYKLIRRGGFIAAPANYDHLSIRKRSVYMFEEGSVFPGHGELNGRIGDLRPDKDALENAKVPAIEHPVWRDGQSIFLPI